MIQAKAFQILMYINVYIYICTHICIHQCIIYAFYIFPFFLLITLTIKHIPINLYYFLCVKGLIVFTVFWMVIEDNNLKLGLYF